MARRLTQDLSSWGPRSRIPIARATWATGIPTIVLDKTGTVTTGRMALVDVATSEGTTVDEALRLVGSLEDASEHPIARAIAAGYTHAAVLHPCGLGCCAVERAGACAARSGRHIDRSGRVAHAPERQARLPSWRRRVAQLSAPSRRVPEPRTDETSGRVTSAAQARGYGRSDQAAAGQGWARISGSSSSLGVRTHAFDRAGGAPRPGGRGHLTANPGALLWDALSAPYAPFGAQSVWRGARRSGAGDLCSRSDAFRKSGACARSGSSALVARRLCAGGLARDGPPVEGDECGTQAGRCSSRRRNFLVGGRIDLVLRR
jgi:hypothetical protein